MKYSTKQKITKELLTHTNISKEYIIKQQIIKLVNDTPLEKLQEIFDVDWVDSQIAKERYFSDDYDFITQEYWGNKMVELDRTNTEELTITLK